MTHLADGTDNCIVSMSVGCVSAEVRFTPNIHAGTCVCVCVWAVEMKGSSEGPSILMDTCVFETMLYDLLHFPGFMRQLSG